MNLFTSTKCWTKKIKGRRSGLFGGDGMRLQAQPLDKSGSKIYFEIEEITSVHPSDRVVYIDGTPCHLDSVCPAPIPGKDQIITELLHLAYLVHAKTKYCVFLEFYGHVDSLEISIRESKQNWETKVLETKFYTAYKEHTKQADPLAYLKAKRDVLIEIIKTEDVPYELCDVERYEVVEYSF